MWHSGSRSVVRQFLVMEIVRKFVEETGAQNFAYQLPSRNRRYENSFAVSSAMPSAPYCMCLL